MATFPKLILAPLSMAITLSSMSAIAEVTYQQSIVGQTTQQPTNQTASDTQPTYNVYQQQGYQVPQYNIYHPATSVSNVIDNTASQFNAMAAAADRGDMARLYQYESTMRGGLFEMYPIYWRLYGNLSSQDPNTIINFVRQYQGSALAEKLVADYAESKARQGDYASIRAVADYITNADASELCAIGLGFNQSSNYNRTLEQKATAWLNTMTKVPALCEKLADEMVYNQGITTKDLKEQLVRMMRLDGRQLSSKQPKTNKMNQIVSLSARLGLGIEYSELNTIKSDPNNFLNNFASYQNTPKNQYLYLYAISQLAHRSSFEVVRQLEYDNTQKRLTPTTLRYGYRAAAMRRMNMNTDSGFGSESLIWFQKSRGEPFNQEEAESYAKSAIYFGQWEDVVHAISAMDKHYQKERVWQYWLGRAYEGLGNKSHGHAFYQSLAGDIDYYGLLARARLGQALTLTDIGGNQAPIITANEQAIVMNDPHFARAITLMRQGAKSEHTTREWNWAVKKARDSNNTRLITLAAKMAQELGNYPRSIYAMENGPARNGAISHPTLYQNAFIGYSNRVGIDPAWAYGITRQESRFQTTAQSSASASGLMQIIPGTARQIARGLGESLGNMNNPETNIRYGTWYLAHLSNDVGGQIAVATAGYNAGPGAARAWRPRSGSAISADQYVEAIPYGETRDYVKNVMANATIYGVLLNNPVSITNRMGTVSPTY